MAKYKSKLTAGLTPENWQEKINLKDMSLNELVDLWGDMKTMEKLGDKVGGFLREVVMARMPEGEDEFSSGNYDVVRSFSESTRIDTQGLKDEFGDDWYADHCNTKDVTKMSLKAATD